MPVLPLVGSSSFRPGSSTPAASASSIIALATRSLIEPVGFWPSSLAYSWTVSERLAAAASRGSSISGVQPTVSSSDGRVSVGLAQPTGDSRKQDDRLALGDRRVQALARADVLAAHVHVHEAREIPVLEDAGAERGEAGDDVGENRTHRPAAGLDHGFAAGLGAKRRR